MKKVYVMRHGKQTEADPKLEGIWRTEAPLQTGAEDRVIQATNALKAIDGNISEFCSSHLVRAKETLGWVMKTYGGQHQPRTIEELGPGQPGEWDRLWREWIGDRNPTDHPLQPAGFVELWPDLTTEEMSRVGGAVQGIAELLPEGASAVAVSHIPLINFAEHALTSPAKPFRQALKYCEVICFTFDNGKCIGTEFLPLI